MGKQHKNYTITEETIQFIDQIAELFTTPEKKMSKSVALDLIVDTVRSNFGVPLVETHLKQGFNWIDGRKGRKVVKNGQNGTKP